MHSPSTTRILAGGVAISLIVGGAWLAMRLRQLDGQVQQLRDDVGAAQEQAAAANAVARQARAERDQAISERDAAAQRAIQAESDADQAQRDREVAEITRLGAETEALLARREAERARQQAADAAEQLERERAERERQLDQMQRALGRIADTQRTALGLVMNLGEEAITFAFDSAELQGPDRELLSRIAGVLLTWEGYRIHVYGHTDDVGSDEYNQRLSERRAGAVVDYLIEAGIPADIITARGWGKAKPLVEGTSQQARDRNRRVEIGVIDATVDFDRALPDRQR